MNDRVAIETRVGQRVLVTGGAGFLGSYVCERLVVEGAHVVCVDSLLTGRKLNVADLKASGRFEFVKADVTLGLPQLQVDEIWNLACAASPPTYQHDPVHTMMTNVLGMNHCLALARKTGARVFQASTSEIYGDPSVHPQMETYRGNVNTIGPRACYDEGKRAAEALCYDYYRTYGVDVRVARIFNTYGPRMSPRDGRVVSNFIVGALNREPLEIYGDGLQTRSFCFVGDLIDGFFCLMGAERNVGMPVNIGNPVEFTMIELAQKVLALTGSHSEIVFRPLPIDDPHQRRPDISVAATELGWRPCIDLDEGLRRTVDYFARELWIAPMLQMTGAAA
ncbi:UDP-glucuronic acid decarboxylase family protein [Burkholderia multivorans]|uniref:UDP-glucuronic acid decarboxylase family protein n=1 Tax=Burkholderia multivorans TaxID=87883 RepID=UPI000CFE82FA|nr:UDP-glucuronic acid decarboxylase family protein [Burkholderia multivorans]MBU9144237.1 SDR family oxidoreductase [Burkholderia multivorans]MBU9280204.1 SDR family oxidoreductase [Burkholderia multivorans]MBU9595566.1 SDR family oxidoreductase [Burkholderia multivorans]MCA8338257.1 SDR family oxidoreductase [Burkholderia multivorans]MDN7477014.1 SDR family oxidoreductase [Burkholderia multivorans]